MMKTIENDIKSYLIQHPFDKGINGDLLPKLVQALVHHKTIDILKTLDKLTLDNKVSISRSVDGHIIYHWNQ